MLLIKPNNRYTSVGDRAFHGWPFRDFHIHRDYIHRDFRDLHSSRFPRFPGRPAWELGKGFGDPSHESVVCEYILSTSSLLGLVPQEATSGLSSVDSYSAHPLVNLEKNLFHIIGGTVAWMNPPTPMDAVFQVSVCRSIYPRSLPSQSSTKKKAKITIVNPSSTM